VTSLVRDLVAQTRRRLFGFCVYCGTPCVGVACACHRDLLQLDPNYYQLRKGAHS
jgi:hypothetical protein